MTQHRDPPLDTGLDTGLDNPVLASLAGRHRSLGRTQGRARAFLDDVAPFAALPSEPTDADWADLAALVGPGGLAVLINAPQPPPAWIQQLQLPGLQMLATHVEAVVDAEAVVLGAADVPEMLALTDLTKPGPFFLRTIELGRYLGLRVDGRLVAMAGERLQPPGVTEISAVCTDPDHRGRGLAARLIRTLVAGIRERGETPILHVVDTNTSAIRVYESLGFVTRREVSFAGHTAPL